MKRNRILPVFILVFTLLFSACSSTADSGGSVDGSAAGVPEASKTMDFNMNEAGDSESELRDSVEETSTANSSGVYSNADSKLIRNASVSIQTVDFSAALAALDALTSRLGGYYENAQIQGGDYYNSNAARYACYTVRIPEESYNDFMNATGDIGHVVSSNETSTDVGDQYYDTELRLKTLQTKQDRLLALLEKAEVMEDIITLENSLSDVQYEIEQLTSTLKRYDGLVDYATVGVTLNEVIKLSDAPGEADSFGKRLSAAFSGGFSDFGAALGDFTVWFAYHLIGIAVFAAVVVAGVFTTRRILDRRRKRAEPPAQ